MPSGTGKTASLLAIITAYQYAHPSVGKLVYCTRTVGEIDKVVLELKRLVKYRRAVLGDRDRDMMGLALSSRRNMCVHEEVSQESDRASTDAKCRKLTAPWVREASTAEGSNVQLCDFYEGFIAAGSNLMIPKSVYTLDDLKAYGKEHNLCPYFLARHVLGVADVITYSFQYLLDPKVSAAVSKELYKQEKDAIVVFDEAHNIDDVCISALSVNLDRRTIDGCSRNLAKLDSTIGTLKATESEKLAQEYKNLLDGLAREAAERTPAERAGNLPDGAIEPVCPPPVLTADALEEVVPGNIRRAEHFVALMRRFLEHLKERMRGKQVVEESTTAFKNLLARATQIESKTLKFCSDRLGSLLRTLQADSLDEFGPVQLVANFAALVGTYQAGFTIIIEPEDDRINSPDVHSVLQLCCLDASIAIKQVFEKFRTVVITSGTLSPMDLYPKILNFTPVTSHSFTMSLSRECVAPLFVTRGSDQVVVTSKFDARQDPAVIRNYGTLLAELAAIVPDGIVCFFVSYRYMEDTVASWHEMGILESVLAHKLVFVETPDTVETSLALENYRIACENGRGAVLLSVARGKVSEGIDFQYHYGRAVVMFGVPFVYTESRVLKARLEFLRSTFQIREGDFLTFDAIRTAAQCVGRVIRSKKDYGLMVFADKRFNRLDKRGKLPKWIVQSIRDQHLNLSTDMALSAARGFYKEMAQSRDPRADLGVTMWDGRMLREYQEREKARFAEKAAEDGGVEAMDE